MDGAWEDVSLTFDDGVEWAAPIIAMETYNVASPGNGSLCDCLGATRRLDVEPPIENPFKPTPAQSSKTVYWIEGPHPAGLKY